MNFSQGKSGNAGSVLVNFAASLVLLLICLFFVLVGICMFAWAFHLFLVERFDPSVAAAISGGAALFLALCLAFVAKRLASTPPKPKTSPGLPSLANRLDMVKEHPFETLLTAFALGMAAGVSPDMRKTLTQVSLVLLAPPGEPVKTD